MRTFQQINQDVTQLGEMCVLESVKAASDVYAPLSGVVCGVNEDLDSEPGLVNNAPYTGGWLVKLSSVKPEELDNLMTAEQYEQFLEQLSDKLNKNRLMNNVLHTTHTRRHTSHVNIFGDHKD